MRYHRYQVANAAAMVTAVANTYGWQYARAYKDSLERAKAPDAPEMSFPSSHLPFEQLPNLPAPVIPQLDLRLQRTDVAALLQIKYVLVCLIFSFVEIFCFRA